MIEKLILKLKLKILKDKKERYIKYIKTYAFQRNAKAVRRYIELKEDIEIEIEKLELEIKSN